jgi:hypothetical protein
MSMMLDVLMMAFMFSLSSLPRSSYQRTARSHRRGIIE